MLFAATADFEGQELTFVVTTMSLRFQLNFLMAWPMMISEFPPA